MEETQLTEKHIKSQENSKEMNSKDNFESNSIEQTPIFDKFIYCQKPVMKINGDDKIKKSEEALPGQPLKFWSHPKLEKNSVAFQRLKSELETTLLFLKENKSKLKKTTSVKELKQILESSDYTRSVLSFCNLTDLDSTSRTSSEINPQNTRYIIAVCHLDVVIHEGQPVLLNCWLIFETRYLLVDFFRKIIYHLICSFTSSDVIKHQRLKGISEAQILEEGQALNYSSQVANFKPFDADQGFHILSSLRESFFSSLLKQHFEKEGVNMSDCSGFKLQFKLDSSLLEYYEALECKQRLKQRSKWSCSIFQRTSFCTSLAQCFWRKAS